MDRPDVFMPLYIGDYLAGTSRLTTELHGAYLLLIMDYWMNGPLPDNDQALASIARMSSDAWSIAQASLKHYFSIENGKWIHKRIEQELASAVQKKAKAKAKAEYAASKRWDNAPSNAPSMPQALPQGMLEQCPSPSPSPSPNKNNIDATHLTNSNEFRRAPISEIVELFNAKFPELPKVVKITEKRKKLISGRWNDFEDIRSIENIDGFFEHIRKSSFLMNQEKQWLSFDWIFDQENFTKIYEGNYHGDKK